MNLLVNSAESALICRAFAGLATAAISTHIDYAAIWKRLIASGTVGIACVDAGAGNVILNPILNQASPFWSPSSRPRLQMIITVDPEVVTCVLWRTVLVPVAGHGKKRLGTHIGVTWPRYVITCLNVAIGDQSVRVVPIVYLMRLIVPHDAVGQYRLGKRFE